MAKFAMFPDPPPTRYRAVAKNGRGQIDLYGVVGGDWFDEGIRLQAVSDDLKKMGDVSAIDVFINSPGGDVFEGRGIYSLLAAHKARITVHVIAEASSIASLIAMVGDEIRMSDGALMMVHRARGLAWGTAAEVRKTADLIDVVDQTLIDTYHQRTKQPKDKLAAMLDAETWMTAAEAVELGFADVVDEPVRAAALAVDRSALGFRNTPASLRPKRAAAMEKIAALRG